MTPPFVGATLATTRNSQYIWSMSVATELRSFVLDLLRREPDVTIRFWDRSSLGSGSTTVHVHGPLALRRILFAPGELGFARAYVSGDIDIDGNIFDVLRVRDHIAAPSEDLEFKTGPS